MKNLYENTKNGLQKSVNNGWKILGLTALGLTAGCSGMKTIPTSDVATTQSVSYDQLKTNPAFNDRKNELFASTSPQAYEKQLQDFLGPKGYDVSIESLDSKDGEIGETEPTKADLIAGNPAGLLLPSNVSTSKDIQPATLDEILDNYPEDFKSKNNNYVGGGMSFPDDGNSYIAVPEGKGSILTVLDDAHKDKIEDMLGDFSARGVSTYRLKQGDNTAAILEVYQAQGNDGSVVPVIDLFHNSYAVSGMNVPHSQIETDETASHQFNDNAKDRYALDALTGGGVAFIHPIVGGGVYMANLIGSLEFGNVVEFAGQKTYNPPRENDESLVSHLAGTPSEGVSITYPVYNGDQLAGVMRYQVVPTNGEMVVDRDGLNIKEDNKYIGAVAKKLTTAGVAAGLYKLGEHEAEDTIVEKVTGRAGRSGGDGVLPR